MFQRYDSKKKKYSERMIIVFTEMSWKRVAKLETL